MMAASSISPSPSVTTMNVPVINGNTIYILKEIPIAGSLSPQENKLGQCVDVDVSAVLTFTDSSGVTWPNSGENVFNALKNYQTKICLDKGLQEKNFILEKIIIFPTGATTMKFRVQKQEDLLRLAAAVTSQSLANLILDYMMPSDKKAFYFLGLVLGKNDMMKGIMNLLKINWNAAGNYIIYAESQYGFAPAVNLQAATPPILDSPGQQTLSRTTQQPALTHVAQYRE